MKFRAQYFLYFLLVIMMLIWIFDKEKKYYHLRPILLGVAIVYGLIYGYVQMIKEHKK